MKPEHAQHVARTSAHQLRDATIKSVTSRQVEDDGQLFLEVIVEWRKRPMPGDDEEDFLETRREMMRARKRAAEMTTEELNDAIGRPL